VALVLRASAFLALSTLLQAADPPPQEVVIHTHPYTPPSAILRAESNLVETGLTVRDSSGHAVAGLKASDFEVLDNGVPREIAAFSEIQARGAAPAPGSSTMMPGPDLASAEGPPKYITFFFDDFHVDNGSMLFVKQGARAYIAKGVRPSDHLSIVTASGEGDLDFTTDAKLFAERIEHLSSHDRTVVTGACGVSPIDSYIFLHNLDGQIVDEAINAAIGCVSCSGMDTAAKCRFQAYGVAQTAASTSWEQLYYQSINTLSALGFAAKKLSQVNGTRIMVLTSSGFLLRPGIPPELQSFIDGAVRWNIVVHAIGAQGLEARMGGPKSFLRASLPLMPLEEITIGTGGHYFRDTNDLAGAMEMAANPEASYVLAFHPGAFDGRFHTLKIRFRTKHAGDLQFRPGYFSPDPKKAASARGRIDEAVFSKETLREIPASVALMAGPAKDGAVPISIRFALDLKGVQFNRVKGRHMQQIVFLTALLDPDDGFVTGKESIMDFALSDEKLASLKKDGLKAIVTLNAPAGTYQVRAIVREGMKGNLAAISAPVEIVAK
jgi:VWFA-related protein